MRTPTLNGPRPPRYRSGGLGGALRDYREFRAGGLGLLARVMAMDSPVVAAGIGPVQLWVVLDADLARQVLVTDEESYGRPAFVTRAFVEAMGENLFTASGRAWSERRRLLQPRFTRLHIDGLVETMAATIAEEVERWPEDTALDMQANLTELTLRVAALTLLGLDVDRHEHGASLRRHFEGVIGWMSHRFFHPTAPPAVIPTRRNRQLARDRAALTAILRSVVGQRRRSSDHPADVLQLLIEATDEAGRPLSDDAIAEECIGFLFAGHETTASTLTWALYELAANPGAQERVAVEGDRLLATGATAETLRDLAYTSRVVDEVLRLYPPGISIARVARRSTTLGDYHLRRGTVVGILLYAIHRNPRQWPGPETFEPDRFLTDRPRASLPFGLGPRQCLGTRFATTEARLALATIASRWRLRLLEPVKPEPRVALALRVDGGLPMQLRRRRP